MSCAYCGPTHKHCKGEVRHAFYKDELRQAPNMRTSVCHTRHCLEPMCDCVDYVEAAEPKLVQPAFVPAPGLYDF